MRLVKTSFEVIFHLELVFWLAVWSIQKTYKDGDKNGLKGFVWRFGWFFFLKSRLSWPSYTSISKVTFPPKFNDFFPYDNQSMQIKNYMWPYYSLGPLIITIIIVKERFDIRNMAEDVLWEVERIYSLSFFYIKGNVRR